MWESVYKLDNKLDIMFIWNWMCHQLEQHIEHISWTHNTKTKCHTMIFERVENKTMCFTYNKINLNKKKSVILSCKNKYIQIAHLYMWWIYRWLSHVIRYDRFKCSHSSFNCELLCFAVLFLLLFYSLFGLLLFAYYTRSDLVVAVCCCCCSLCCCLFNGVLLCVRAVLVYAMILTLASMIQATGTN